jgi:protease IV
MEEDRLIAAVDRAFQQYKYFQIRRLVFRIILIFLIVVCASFLIGPKHSSDSYGNIADFEKHIAVIDINDMMSPGSVSRQELALLDKQGNKDSIKAIVLRVDSPGSGVTDAEAVYNQLKYYQNLGIPVVASYTDSATSGAYLISCMADRIFSYRNSVVGSIGVILEVPQVKPLMDKFGVSVVAVRSGALKASAQPFESLNSEAKNELQRLVDKSATWFHNLVKSNRGLSAYTMKELAKGGVYTGEEAFELGLVDEIGEYYDAIAWLYETYPELHKNKYPIINYEDYIYIPYQGGFNPVAEFMTGNMKSLSPLIQRWLHLISFKKTL